MDVPATTVNKVCLSGLNAIYLADLLINAGEADIVVAGGMESMTQAPYLLPGARAGYRLGDGTVVDSMMYDGLFCAFDHCAMGLGTERYNGADGVSRERQDAFSALSHERAAAAAKEGRFADEIIPVSVPQRKGDPLVVDTDEGVRPETTAESLGKLRPAFDKNGTITAGNASQISDGGAAVIVMSKAKADELGMAPLGELVSYGQVAGPSPSLLHQPSHAITVALDKAGLATGDIDLFEINEAFAAVGSGLRRRPRHQGGQGERQRGRDRPRSPGGHVRHPGGPHRAARAQAPRRRHGRGRPVRWRRPGRCRRASHHLTSTLTSVLTGAVREARSGPTVHGRREPPGPLDPRQSR